MSFPRYPKYKGSGVEWLGEVPVHWSVAPAKWHMRSATGGTSIKGHCADETAVGLYPGFSASGQDVWLAGYDFEVPGIVLSAVGARCGKTFKADGAWGVVANTHCVFPTQGSDRDYLWFLTNREDWWEKGGSAQPFVKVSDTLARKWVFPPLTEQTQIAAFLDRETAKIDALVAEQRRLMELLKEKRQAVISHAVTQGLNPHAPMKPSGIEWLGDVPAHWELTKLSRLTTKIGDGLHGTPEYVDESPFRFINGNNLIDGAITLTETTRSVSKSEFEKHSVDLDQTSVLLSINGTIGNLALFRGELVMLGKSAAYVNCDEKLKREYLCLYLKSSFISRYFEHSVTGTTIFNLSLDSVRRLPMVLPPINEQEVIIAFLDTESTKFDTLTTEAQRAIDLLQERRTALISAAVTGQIDVRQFSQTQKVGAGGTAIRSWESSAA